MLRLVVTWLRLNRRVLLLDSHIANPWQLPPRAHMNGANHNRRQPIAYAFTLCLMWTVPTVTVGAKALVSARGPVQKGASP